MNGHEYLTAYYGGYDEDGRLASRHGMVEFLTTMRYIEKYLASGMKVLEVGAGTGRYSHALARRGYEVTAVELVQSNIDVLNSKTLPGEPITVMQGNATDLSRLGGESFDMTLLLGPLYHLYTVDDQKKAVAEALRVTKTGGVLFAAYCISDAAIINYGFVDGNIDTLIEKKMLDAATFKAYSTPADIFQLYRKEDIDGLMEDTDTVRLHYVGTDMATNYIRETMDAMDDGRFRLYLDYHFAICERPDLVGATHHSLDIVRKLG